MNKLLTIILLILSTQLNSQNKLGIYCKEIKINNTINEKSKTFKNIIESVLSNLKFPPIIIERNDLNEVIDAIEIEKNINIDFNKNQNIQKLEAANVDYILDGEFNSSLISEYIEFHFTFIKISGANVTSKFISPILRFKENELNNTIEFEKKLKNEFEKYSFTKEFGIIERNKLEEINSKLELKDNEIKHLKLELNELKSGIEKFTFNGDSISKNDNGESIINGTLENFLYLDLTNHFNKKENDSILIKCNNYYKFKPYSIWQTPNLFLAIYYYQNKMYKKSFELFDLILENCSGEKDYIINIASYYKYVKNKERYDLLLENVSKNMKNYILQNIKYDD